MAYSVCNETTTPTFAYSLIQLPQMWYSHGRTCPIGGYGPVYQTDTLKLERNLQNMSCSGRGSSTFQVLFKNSVPNVCKVDSSIVNAQYSLFKFILQ